MDQATTHDTDVLETIRETVGNACTDKVFGHPISQNGLTVLPVAKVSGGGGGGRGRNPAEDGHEATGSGGGLGMSAKPLGVFVIKDNAVGWRPAVDINKIVLGGQIVVVTALLVLRALIRTRGRRDRTA